jgi:hypothetical protein
MRKKVCCLAVAVAMLAAGCGYRFAGGGDFPFGVKKIFVPVFENRTSETGIETVFTNDFIYEFTRDGKVDVVERQDADAVFSGKISRLNTQTVARSGTQSPLERRVTVYLDLNLIDGGGNVLWTARGVSDDETYEVVSEKLAEERLKRSAIKVLSKRMAEMVYGRVTDIE